MKETVFRKKLKTQEMNIDNDMDGVADTSYQFSISPIFKSPLSTETSVIIVGSHNHNEKDSIDFMISKEDCDNLINYFKSVRSYIDERNEIIENLLERFRLVKDGYEAGDIEKVEVYLCDENPYSSNYNGNKACLLRFEPVASITCSKFFTPFYAIVYVTGVIDADKKIFDPVLKDVPLVYDNALKKRGERIKKEQYNDAMKSMDERMNKFKEKINK